MPQVAVLLPMSVKVSRDMRRGILQYVRRHGPWGLHIIEGRQGEQKLIRMKEWGCTGIFGRLYTPELVEAASRAKVPQVLVDPEERFQSKGHPLYRHSLVRSDTAAVGRLAAEYFLARKFTHYAYVGEVQGLCWSVRRGEAFAEAIRQAGFDCRVYGPLTEAEKEDAGLERARLCAWLRGLPKPVALLAAMDNRGRQVMDACAWAGLAVPRDIAVLGVDNDDDLCETTTPPMSSILLEAERASYEAARHLDDLMRGATRRRKVITYGPAQVISRRSTDTTQISDVVVVKALEFIAVNACSGIGVPDVVRHVRASRRLAEQRFRGQLGRTVLDEIRRVRLERVRTLLRETNLSIGEIAHACGFDSESHLGTVFRREHGCTMRDFRKRQ
jgi:LacI family transcriptional regulator